MFYCTVFHSKFTDINIVKFLFILLYSNMKRNIKVAGKDMPEMLEKIQETFNTYWHSDNFTEYNENLLGASRYIFLGGVRHKSHNGSNPVSIIWQMEENISPFPDCMEPVYQVRSG